jgi:uncharacterized protein YjbI with pentapeptide repeats
LQATDFGGAKLEMAGVNAAVATAARFDQADLTLTRFGYSDLKGAVFSGARFRQTDFHCALLDGSISAGASGSTLPADQPRAIAELYDPRHVTQTDSGE